MKELGLWDKPSSKWQGRKHDGTTFYTTPSKHGLRYMCKYCGKRTVGIGTTDTGELTTSNHYPRCMKHPENIRKEELKNSDG